MAKASRSFVYQKRTKEQFKERANMRGGGFNDFIKKQYKKFKVRDGKNIVRILPPTWENASHYAFDVYVNYGIGPDNSAYLSLSKHKRGADPIADALREANRSGDEELAKKLAPTQRALMWVIDRQDEEEGPQLWAAPFSKIDKAFVNLARDDDTGEVVFVDDPDTGCDIRFYKEGQGLKTEYDASRMKLMDAAPLSDDDKQLTEWLEYVQENPVPDTLQFYDADYISEVYNGKPAKKSVDDDEADAPKRARPAAKKPEVDEDEDDELDEVTVRTTRKKPAVEDEAPFDEDDAPAKKGSLRDRINARRKAATAESEEDED